MADLIPCKITVGLEEFTLQVGTEEEEFVRKAAKLINEKVEQHQKNTKIYNPNRLIALAALDFAIYCLKFNNKHDSFQNEINLRLDKLSELTDFTIDA
jgi:cell division protein ZapA